MQTVVDFLSEWADLIGGVFVEYTLVAALLTAAAVGGFFYLRKHPTKQLGTNPILNAFAVLVLWLIAVPLFGTIIDVIIGVIDHGWAGVAFIYDHFQDQPIYVIALLAVAVVAHFVWGWIAKSSAPRAWLRAVLVGVAFFVVVGITVPVINEFFPPDAPEEESEKAN